MGAAAAGEGVQASIRAVEDTAMDAELPKADILLTGPQVRCMKKKMEKEADSQIPADVIDVKDCGMMNGKAVGHNALKELDRPDPVT